MNEPDPSKPNNIAFDIETTDLYPRTSEIVSWSTEKYGIIQTRTITEKDILMELCSYFEKMNKHTTTVITFNGGTNYKKGFDFPYIRTKLIQYKLPYVFKNFNHVDLFPIILNNFILDFLDYKVVKDLNVDELKKMIVFFGSKPGKNKDDHISIINELITEEEVNEYLIEHVDQKVKPHYGLKDSCLHLLGIEGFGIDGKKVPGMFAEWKETGDDSIVNEILEYNRDDCIKTKALFDEVKEYVSNRTMSGELL